MVGFSQRVQVSFEPWMVMGTSHNLCLERTQNGMLSWKGTSISDRYFSIFILNESSSVLAATGYLFLPSLLFNFNFYYLFNVGCSRSLLLRAGFLWLQWWVGTALCRGAWASHGSGISCGAQVPGAQASVVAAWRLNSCGDGLSCSESCGIFLDQGLQGAFLCMWKLSLISRMRNMWSFISYLGRAQPPLSSYLYGVSVHRGEIVQPGAGWSVSGLCCLFQIWEIELRCPDFHPNYSPIILW